jgi:hypothetical protein
MGRWVNPCDPAPYDIVIEDIAYALSHQARYNGHHGPYNVAQHSVLVSYECPTMPALLHDAPETYIGDLSHPIKYGHPALGKAFREVEDVVARRVEEAFGLPRGSLDSAWVKAGRRPEGFPAGVGVPRRGEGRVRGVGRRRVVPKVHGSAPGDPVRRLMRLLGLKSIEEQRAEPWHVAYALEREFALQTLLTYRTDDGPWAVVFGINHMLGVRGDGNLATHFGFSDRDESALDFGLIG